MRNSSTRQLWIKPVETNCFNDLKSKQSNSCTNFAPPHRTASYRNVTTNKSSERSNPKPPLDNSQLVPTNRISAAARRERGREGNLGVLVLVGVVDLRELAVCPTDFLIGGFRREVQKRVELPPVLRLRLRRHHAVRLRLRRLLLLVRHGGGG